MSISLRVNGTDHEIQSDGETPLLWVLRDELGLKGSKFGCGMGQCGACTVHVDGGAVRSCITPVEQVSGAITTIEGLATDAGLHPVQEAWIDHNVPSAVTASQGRS